ncbi:hypothetical protein J132_03071 [Termitomyces sp. J132]|nr:hypothetical protein J132_03071 [Termitomyces sp. J132]
MGNIDNFNGSFLDGLEQESSRNVENRRRTPNSRSTKNTKAAIQIGTLNLRGYRMMGSSKSETKWNHINQIIRDKKIGILMVQETHLTEERKNNLEKVFSKRMLIFHSGDPENPTSKGGVAVVLNHNLINVQGAEMTEIIPGRAMMVSSN